MELLVSNGQRDEMAKINKKRKQQREHNVRHTNEQFARTTSLHVKHSVRMPFHNITRGIVFDQLIFVNLWRTRHRKIKEREKQHRRRKKNEPLEKKSNVFIAFIFEVKDAGQVDSVRTATRSYENGKIKDMPTTARHQTMCNP